MKGEDGAPPYDRYSPVPTLPLVEHALGVAQRAPTEVCPAPTLLSDTSAASVRWRLLLRLRRRQQ